MMNQRARSNVMLVLTALIWGSAFVAQSVGMDYLGPFTFNGIRSLLGGLVLLPVIWFMGKRKAKVQEPIEKKEDKKTLLIGGVCCGIALTAGSSLQQIGLMYTSAGKAGFITALYILIVPVMGLLLGKKAGGKTWLGVGLAVIGMYFLCMKEGFSISKGDFMVLLCAVAFSIHILVIDYFSPKVDGVKLSCIQFFVCGVICIVPALLTEQPVLLQILEAKVPLLYAGVMSCGVAYTMQVVAQKNTDPTVASLILSLESVFAALTGWLLIGEKLTPKELFGCVLVFAAIIMAQLPERQGAGAKTSSCGQE